MLGELKYFCNCLLKNHKEHKVAVDSDEKCVYCGHYAIKRKVTEADIRTENKYGDKIDRLKREHLEIIIKDRRHNEKVN
jgi:hypothetical protein